MIRKNSCESVLCAAPLPTPVRGGARPCLPTRQLPSHSKQGSDLNLAPLSRPEIKGGQTITNSVQNWDSTRKIPGDIILLATNYCYLLLHYFFISVPKKRKNKTKTLKTNTRQIVGWSNYTIRTVFSATKCYYIVILLTFCHIIKWLDTFQSETFLVYNKL